MLKSYWAQIFLILNFRERFPIEVVLAEFDAFPDLVDDSPDESADDGKDGDQERVEKILVDQINEGHHGHGYQSWNTCSIEIEVKATLTDKIYDEPGDEENMHIAVDSNNNEAITDNNKEQPTPSMQYMISSFV